MLVASQALCSKREWQTDHVIQAIKRGLFPFIPAQKVTSIIKTSRANFHSLDYAFSGTYSANHICHIKMTRGQDANRK